MHILVFLLETKCRWYVYVARTFHFFTQWMIFTSEYINSFAILLPSGSVLSSMSVGLNMAEALVHAPSRSQSIPQVSVKTQRLEELAIKQSRQLIPVTPSIPKALEPRTVHLKEDYVLVVHW
ncbi:hypothetical protein MTR_2g461250 [Medicago truncatula]|uniref:Uncharacterized protein n=1 Tax=Medicago truncatula TaxID=3880 RepID=A0A072V9M6_MEDTR|nr:hypothetical protein MTR_2g461250 [Medicago truncatula]